MVPRRDYVALGLGLAGLGVGLATLVWLEPVDWNVGTAFFWLVFGVWQGAPLFLVGWLLHEGGISILGGVAIGLVLAVAAIGAEWISLTDDSSTAVLGLLFFPFYLLVAACVLCLVEWLLRRGVNRFRQ